MSEALLLLQKYWKHETFRTPQEEIIQSVLDGNDTFALLPTAMTVSSSSETATTVGSFKTTPLPSR